MPSTVYNVAAGWTNVHDEFIAELDGEGKLDYEQMISELRWTFPEMADVSDVSQTSLLMIYVHCRYLFIEARELPRLAVHIFLFLSSGTPRALSHNLLNAMEA